MTTEGEGGEIERAPSWPSTVVRMGFSLVPRVGGALQILAEDVGARRRERVTELGTVARDEVGDDERFVARLRADPRLADMLIDASEAAGRTNLEGKRRAMGKVVGRAVLDDALVERGQLLVAALADLDAPHFRLLAEIEQAASPEAAAVIPVPEPLRAALIRHGVVETAGTYGGGLVVTGLSEFGRELLDYVRNAGEALGP